MFVRFMKYIIVIGSPVDGFTFRGPFDSHDEAHAVAERLNESWWITTIEKEEEEEAEEGEEEEEAE